VGKFVKATSLTSRINKYRERSAVAVNSYFRFQQIQAPNEYDCMMMCEIRCKKNYYPPGIKSKAYCTLKLAATSNGALPLSHQSIQGPRDEDGGGIFLSPRKFRMEFEKSVRKALEDFHQQRRGYTIGEISMIIKYNIFIVSNCWCS